MRACMQVYDTITEAMLASMARLELQPGASPQQLSKWQHLMAGCAAGAAGTAVSYPLETLRSHMAVGGQSYRACLTEILQKHGHVGLYKGFTSGLVRGFYLLLSMFSSIAPDSLKVH